MRSTLILKHPFEKQLILNARIKVKAINHGVPCFQQFFEGESKKKPLFFLLKILNI